MFKHDLKISREFSMVFILILFTATSLFAQEVLVPKGAVWKYLDDGSNQGTAWRTPNFDDSSWAEGPAQLGYGDGDEATVVSYGADADNKYITTYFRHWFEISDPSQYEGLVLRLLRDDGAVVYLNGREIVRSNISFGIVTYQMRAASVVSGDAEKTYFEYYPAVSSLVQGSNVLAVEIHQASPTSSDISFDLELATTKKLPESFRKGPYLIYPGDVSQMTILWQLKEQLSECTLQWGIDSLYTLGSVPVQEYDSDHQYKYTLDTLAADTEYDYRVIADTDTVSGSFHTAPAPEATSLKFFVYGDTRSQPQRHNDVASAILATMKDAPEFQTFIISTGDLVANGDNESDWENQFFNPTYRNIQALLANLPYQAALGNHERHGKLFAKYFPYPFVQNGRYYWSFDYGPAHFIIVDQFTSYAPGSAQYDWMVNDLASTEKQWKFIALHKPGWSAGGHGNNTEVQNYIQPLCEKYGVTMVLAGHNHYYARAVVNGVYHITAGGGGAPLYSPDSSYPHIVKANASYHFCKIVIQGDSLHFAAVSSNRQTIDEFSMHVPATKVVDNGSTNVPDKVQLYPAYPNPFNPSTTISFTIPTRSLVRLNIYNMMGEKIKTLISEQLLPGFYKYEWDGTNEEGTCVSSGIYWYRLQTNSSQQVRKVILMR